MRENTEQNENLLSFLEAEAKAGKTVQEARQEAIKKFNYGGKNPSHTLRAHLARLADPKKYEGKYSVRAKKFQQERNNKTIAAEAQPIEVETQPVEAGESA